MINFPFLCFLFLRLRFFTLSLFCTLVLENCYKKAEVASSFACASPPFACASLAFERLRAKVLQAKAEVAFE
jgi:hypothetical protein